MKKLFILGITLITIVVVVFMIHNPVYYGSIKVTDKQKEDNDYILTFQTEENGINEKVVLNDGVKFSENDTEISLKEAWYKLQVNNTYQVLLIENRFPYNIIKDDFTIKDFYIK